MNSPVESCIVEKIKFISLLSIIVLIQLVLRYTSEVIKVKIVEADLGHCAVGRCHVQVSLPLA